MNKLIVILGPTASGKSSLGIALAREFASEIVSADSRQVYRGMDIGSGKVTPEEQAQIPHHLLDIVEPTADFSLAHYQKAAFAAIDDIIARNKTPFLVGGTALYIYSVIDNYNLSDVGANLERRKELGKMSVEELQEILNSLLSRQEEPPLGPLLSTGGEVFSVSVPPPVLRRGLGGGLLNEDDWINPRRLIRAIEKLEAGITLAGNKKPPRYDVLLLGTDVAREELYKKIDQRVDSRIKDGMIEEVIKLRQHVPDEKLISFGLEYRFITEYLMGKYKANACQPLAETKEIMIERLKGAIHAFARRQMTWWRKDKRIVWIKNQSDADKKIAAFLERKAAD